MRFVPHTPPLVNAPLILTIKSSLNYEKYKTKRNQTFWTRTAFVLDPATINNITKTSSKSDTYVVLNNRCLRN